MAVTYRVKFPASVSGTIMASLLYLPSPSIQSSPHPHPAYLSFVLSTGQGSFFIH